MMASPDTIQRFLMGMDKTNSYLTKLHKIYAFMDEFVIMLPEITPYETVAETISLYETEYNQLQMLYGFTIDVLFLLMQRFQLCEMDDVLRSCVRQSHSIIVDNYCVHLFIATYGRILSKFCDELLGRTRMERMNCLPTLMGDKTSAILEAGKYMTRFHLCGEQQSPVFKTRYSINESYTILLIFAAHFIASIELQNLSKFIWEEKIAYLCAIKQNKLPTWYPRKKVITKSVINFEMYQKAIAS